jgi:uncharacterized protein YqfB (UPF0267 family)
MGDIFVGITKRNAPTFNTAAAGSNTITLRDPSDTSQFSTGMRVFICGFDQQFGGCPYNAR